MTTQPRLLEDLLENETMLVLEKEYLDTADGASMEIERLVR